MKPTLLEYVQIILSKMDSDEVNSIADTTEARQVADIVRTAYFNIVSRANLPEHYDTFSLEASGDTDLPVLMTKPENVSRIDWIKYNMPAESSDPDNYQYVTILPFQQFVDMMHMFNTDDTGVDTLVFNDKTYYFRTDRNPSFCTTVGDQYIIFDAHDISLDSTLQESKTMCWGRVVPTFEISDTFVPDLDEVQVPLLLNEATSLAFLELKQIAHEQAISESRRQWRDLQKTKDLIKPNYFDQLPNFGRK